jgi:nucleotide-binding universal stress UspA family protein
MPKPIVVALDPEGHDASPLILGSALARLTGAPLVLAAAYLRDAVTRILTDATLEAMVQERTLARLQHLTEGTDAEIEAAGGVTAAAAIRDAAVRRGAGLLVVGASERGPLGRIEPGATAERLLRQAPCPVLVAPPGVRPDWAPDAIGVGFLPLRESRAALDVGAGLARRAHARLRVLTAVEPATTGRTAAIPAYGTGRTIEAGVVEARRTLEAAVADAATGVATRADAVLAAPADALTELSRDVDLMVCGSRRLRPAHAALAGSVAHALVRRAHCPLLLVPAQADVTLFDRPARAAVPA